ncbi:MAG: hypothetical protein WC008_02840 [Bacilli bacterium]|jgi:hypothetical protein
MEIKWFSKSMQKLATIYETNITLNTVASSYFKDAFTTMIGYEKATNSIIVKPVSKDELNMGLYKQTETHKISIKPSYGRINGKKIIQNIQVFHPLDFSNNNYYKYECEWDKSKNLLKIHLDREAS